MFNTDMMLNSFVEFKRTKFMWIFCNIINVIAVILIAPLLNKSEKSYCPQMFEW